MIHCGIVQYPSMRGRVNLPHDVEAYQLNLEPQVLPHGGDCKNQKTKASLYAPKQTTLKQVPTHINATFGDGEGN